MELGMKFNEIRAKSSILQVFPFNSEKKRGGVAVHVKDSEVHLHWKGAAEIVLSFCTSYLDSEGSIQPMDPQKMEDFKRGIEVMAEASLRCVAFAFRPFEMDKVPKEDQRSDWAIPEDELVLIGIAGIKDPFRPGVRDSVNLCTKAGVKVMGRSSPNGKLLFVRALRNRGHVVAITGDGTNDAPALHEADIGLSMRIQGTEVAKESSDIIILDDDFASVVKVVRWGRSVYDNIQKFIQFQPTVNVAALVINVVAAVSTGNVPLNAVQWWPGGCLCTFNCQRKNYDKCLDDHSPLLCR